MHFCANHDAPFRYTVSKTGNERVFFMRTNSYQPQHYPPRRRRRCARKWFWRTVRSVVCLAAALVLAVVLFTHFDANASAYVTDFTIPGDTTPPVISGVRDLYVYEGETVLYRDGVTASDESDVAPTLEIDSRNVDTGNPGIYQVTYTATDSAGNSTTQTATVTVLDWQGGYVTLDTIYKTVDTQLASIITEEMTLREQVEAIYSWARTSLSYSSQSNKSDRFQAAYQMLLEYSSDCFGYYAVTKLMFDRLDIPNIDVRKVKNSAEDSDHYWSLVSVDGGNTYYHFDATPRFGEGDDFCLVTDAFLDAYSKANKNSHNRDTSLYPATPEA